MCQGSFDECRCKNKSFKLETLGRLCGILLFFHGLWKDKMSKLATMCYLFLGRACVCRLKITSITFFFCWIARINQNCGWKNDDYRFLRR